MFSLGQYRRAARARHGHVEVAEGGYPWAPPLDGGFTVLELPSREEGIVWAARIAKACRSDQELRVFQFNPKS
jgi:hypothetical protein